MGKDIQKMTLAEIKEHQATNAEIKEHQATNAEIEKALGTVPTSAGTSVYAEGFGAFTDLRDKFVIVRTYSAGVFAGIMKARSGKEVELQDARRLWSWSGAASLSQMANEGVKNPKECKFAQAVSVYLIEAIEILPVTEAARKNIEAVPVWEV